MQGPTRMIFVFIYFVALLLTGCVSLLLFNKLVLQSKGNINPKT